MVRKPLLAESGVNDEGNIVVFDTCGSFTLPNTCAGVASVRMAITVVQGRIPLHAKNGRSLPLANVGIWRQDVDGVPLGRTEHQAEWAWTMRKTVKRKRIGSIRWVEHFESLVGGTLDVAADWHGRRSDSERRQRRWIFCGWRTSWTSTTEQFVKSNILGNRGSSADRSYNFSVTLSALCPRGGRAERHPGEGRKELEDGSKVPVVSWDYCFLGARNRISEAEVEQRGDGVVLAMHEGGTKSNFSLLIPAKRSWLRKLRESGEGDCSRFGQFGETTEWFAGATMSLPFLCYSPRWSGLGLEMLCKKTWKMLPKLLRIHKSECPDFVIRLTRHKWPKSLTSMEDPVVPLERNLHGHPLAGLLWERQFEKVLLKHGWEKVSIWECLFVHREKGLSLSLYVDDMKLVGKKQNLDPMWKVLNKEVDLGKPTSPIIGFLSVQRHNVKKQRCCGQLQNHVRIANFRGGNWIITIIWESSYFFVVTWHVRPCQEMCGAISKQDDTTTLPSDFEEMIFYGRWINLNDRLRNGTKLVKNAWID